MIFKDVYREYNEEIKPDRALVEQMLERSKERTFWEKAFIVLKPFAVVAAVCFCLLFTIPVMADAVPDIGQLLAKISPQLAEYFVPVRLSDDSEGIRMEVVAINVQETEVQVYITMQDLVGNRLDETTDLYDSYYLSIPFECTSHCQNLGYDEETKTITFLISISPWDNEKANWYELIKYSRITFGVREFIGQKTEYEDVEIPISLTEADRNPDTMRTHLTGRSGLYAEEEESLWNVLDPRPAMKVLRPGEADARSPIPEVPITGFAYVDGYLHIQHARLNVFDNDNHGQFFLRDKLGNERLYDGSASFFGTTKDTKDTIYEEFVYKISPEELENYTLHGWYVISDLHVEGNWKVKFTLED